MSIAATTTTQQTLTAEQPLASVSLSLRERYKIFMLQHGYSQHGDLEIIGKLYTNKKVKLQKAIDKGRSDQFVSKCLNKLQSNFLHMSFVAPKTRFLNLYEKAGAYCSFDRLKSNRRHNMEELILVNAKSLPKREPLRYLGIGTDECLQDFINLYKLLKVGFKDIEAVLLDLKYADKEVEEYLRPDLESLAHVAAELGGNIEIKFESSLKNVSGQFHIIEAMGFDDLDKGWDFQNPDFQEAFNTIIESYGLLDINGHFYLGVDNFDLSFNTNAILGKIDHDLDPERQRALDNLSEHLSSEVRGLGKRDVSVAFLSDQFYLDQWICLLPAVAEYADRIHLSLVVDMKFHKKYLEIFLSAVCGKQVTVKDLLNYKDLREKQDITTFLFSPGDVGSRQFIITWLKENQSKAIQFFNMQAQLDGELEWASNWKWSEMRGAEFFDAYVSAHPERITSLYANLAAIPTG